LFSSDFSSQTTNDDPDHRPTTSSNTIAMAPKKGAKTADSINAKLALTIKVRMLDEFRHQTAPILTILRK
jgi:hypothetical protein